MADAYIATLVTLGYTPEVRLSSFDQDATVGTRTFTGGKVISAGNLETGKETPDRRLTLRLAAVDSADLNRYLADQGPVDVTVEWMASQDGQAWTLLPKKHVGRQSAILVTAGVAEMTVETRRGTVFAGQPRVMTSADQRERYKTPTPDEAFDYAERFKLEGIIVHPPG